MCILSLIATKITIVSNNKNIEERAELVYRCLNTISPKAYKYVTTNIGVSPLINCVKVINELDKRSYIFEC